MTKFLFIPSLLLFATLISASPSAPSLPADNSSWLDGKVLQWSQLKGKVVLLNVWTFACWNSYRSLPWLATLQQKFPELVIIGIHSPEFSYEKDRKQLRQVMQKYGISYPQVLDDDHSYWKKLDNRYWPAFYLVDKQGKIRETFMGETHTGDEQAQRIEASVAALTKE
jgi:thiol-disulfide isomerase/thioredoxin